jgi:hypothetical protein
MITGAGGLQGDVGGRRRMKSKKKPMTPKPMKEIMGEKMPGMMKGKKPKKAKK